VKSKKKKNWLAWVLGVLVLLAIPMAFVAKAVWSTFRVKVGQNKNLINTIVRDNYAKKPIDNVILDTSRNQVHNIFNKAEKEKGKFLALGVADTIPSFEDALNDGAELSYNLPVQFEKGFVTFTFRVRNKENDQQVIWAEMNDGILPHDDVKMRIRKHIP
jgi:hypothetical protein